MVKFEYVGQNHPDGMKDLDLAFNQIVSPTKVFYKGDTVEVPDEKKDLIKRLSVNGVWEKVEATNTYKKIKKGEDD